MHSSTKEPTSTRSRRDWATPERRELLDARLGNLIGPRYHQLRERSESLLEALADPTVAAPDLVEQIEAQPTLAVYLRERANRPFFGAVTAHQSIAEILMLLGREKVARLVLAQSLRRLLEPSTMATRRLTERLWRQGRLGAEMSVRVALEVAQRRDGGVVDVRALDLVYGRSLVAPLAAVLALFLGDHDESFLDEPLLAELSCHDLAATLALSWGASAALASDLAQLDQPDAAEDFTIDLIVVGQALAQAEGFALSMPPSPATLSRLGFEASDWPRLWTNN